MKRVTNQIMKHALTGSQEDERVACKFFVALVLHECVQEVPPEAVGKKYNVDLAGLRGLQVRQSGAALVQYNRNLEVMVRMIHVWI